MVNSSATMKTQWISKSSPAIVLAPMEGVTDAPMRALMTERGGFSYCVSEFLRVSQEVLPARTFYDNVPELRNPECTTDSQVPVQIQLLGGHPGRLALSALRAVEAGAKAIDLNFGCPAPTVNRHDGGASLLKHPDRIQEIVSEVRKALPLEIPVSAKLRLGWESMEDIYLNAEKAALGGASWLTIHGRTRMQGYIPPAYWKYIGEVRKQLDIPIVANGEIWTREDFLRCREETGCQHFMIGRSALADPSLPLAMASELGILPKGKFDLENYGEDPVRWLPIVKRFAEVTENYSNRPHYTACRIKQWFRYVNMRVKLPWFEQIKRAASLEEIFSILNS